MNEAKARAAVYRASKWRRLTREQFAALRLENRRQLGAWYGAAARKCMRQARWRLPHATRRGWILRAIWSDAANAFAQRQWDADARRFAALHPEAPTP